MKTITLYHGTKKENMANIRRIGLMPGKDGEIDLVDNKLYAESYAGSGGFVIKVRIPVNLITLQREEDGEDVLIFGRSKINIPKKYIVKIYRVL